MPPVKPSEIVEDVMRVLPKGKGHYVTSIQILNRLPSPIRTKLISGRGWPGANSGRYYTPANDVAKAADMLVRKRRADKTWLDTKDLKLQCAGKTLKAGNPSCALYRAI